MCVRRGIFYHGTDAARIAFFAFLVYLRGDDDTFGVDTLLHESDVGSLFSGNVLDDSSSAERQQVFVDLLPAQSGFLAQLAFIDVGVVGEQSCIASQDGL